MSRYGAPDHPGQPDDESTGRADYGGQDPQPYSPSPIPAGPGYDPGQAPTHYANYPEANYSEAGHGKAGHPGPAQPRAGHQAHESTGFPAITGPERKPWFRRRSVLIGWFVLIAIMIALVFWGIVQLTSRGPGGRAPAPGTTSSTATSSTTTTAATTATTTGTATTTRPPAAPPGGAPPHQPAHPPAQPPAVEPPHRPRLPSLPSVITIPPIPKAPEVPTVITLPGR